MTTYVYNVLSPKVEQCSKRKKSKKTYFFQLLNKMKASGEGFLSRFLVRHETTNTSVIFEWNGGGRGGG